MMMPAAFKVFLALAVTAPVKGDDCPPAADLAYCGGAHGDAEEEISCTPFPSKSREVPPYQWEDYCNSQDMAKYAGKSDGAKAWIWNGGNADNYWVFHGCDGAGWMDDCMGGTGYVEQFGPWLSETIPLTLNSCSDLGPDWKYHCTQPFSHPGTNQVYQWYNAGMFTWGGGNWPDKVANKPWWDNMGLKDTSDLDNGPGTAFLIMYPWVCNTDDPRNLGWLWGDHTPYGDKTYKTKCYYDNEPWDNDHWSGTTVPPVWQAYKFYYDDATQTLKAWMLAEKKAGSKDPDLYYLNNASPYFELEAFDGPWIAEE